MRSVEYLGSAAFALLLALPFAVGPGELLLERHDSSLARPHVLRDLAQIKHDTLRVLVLPDPLTWEQRPGASTGLEWELLQRFAKRYRMPVKAVPIANRDSMLHLLQAGKGDVIAAQLSPAGWASRYTLASWPYRHVAQMTGACRSSAKAAQKAGGDTVIVSAWSPFLDSLGQLPFTDAGFPYRVVDSLPDDLLMATALGRQGLLLASDATASLETKRLPLVQFGPRLGNSTPLVFAMRTNSIHLAHALDTWLASARYRDERNALIEAYENGLGPRKDLKPTSSMAFGTDSISDFDSLFQVHADSMAWDWKLLAAVAYKESRFDTTARSYKGANGLMQMMPATAARMGLADSAGVEGHVQAATRYLDQLDQLWRRSIPSPAERLRFVLASYNAGPGHVKDAQRLAVELGMFPDRWEGNVERAIVLLNRPRYFTGEAAKNGYCRGQDTYWYVRDVTGLYAWMSGKPKR